MLEILFAAALLGVFGFLLAGATGDFLFVYAVTFLKIPVTNGYLLQMAAAGTQIIGLLAGGWLGDRIGRQKVNFVTAVLAALVSLPLFRWGIAGGSLGQLALAAALLLLMATVSAAVAYAAFVEITPKRHRAGLVGIGYGLVVGLDGTGDQTTQTPFTTQSLNAMLQQLGINVPAGTTVASVTDATNHTYTDTFKVAIAPNTRETKVNMAIDKAAIMNRFKQGELQVLVSTTVVEVRAPDAPGTLYRLAHAITLHSLDIRSAVVATLGHEVVDVFYVTQSGSPTGRLHEDAFDELRTMLRDALA